MEIIVTNAQRKTRFDLAWLKAFAKKALRECLLHPAAAQTVLPGLSEISVRIVSDAEIARLHVEFMGIEGPTDVITFDHGDIVISAETAAANAQQYGKTLEEELGLCLLHGLLHLNGYTDKEKTEARRMGRLQERLLKKLCC